MVYTSDIGKVITPEQVLKDGENYLAWAEGKSFEHLMGQWHNSGYAGRIVTGLVMLLQKRKPSEELITTIAQRLCSLDRNLTRNEVEQHWYDAASKNPHHFNVGHYYVLAREAVSLLNQ